MKKFLVGASVLALVAGNAGVASAQAIVEGPSILSRILDDITSVTTINGGNVDSVYGNIAATSASIADGLDITEDQNLAPDVDQVLGNIDASVNVTFLSDSTQPLLSETVTPQLDSAGDAVLAGGDVVATTFQAMEGTLGDITTLTLGASLDAASSVTLGANQDVAEALADNTTLGVNQRTDMANTLAMNAALNSVDLDSSVTLTATNYAVAASAISTTAIGAVGGGSITAGTMEILDRSIASVVGQ